MAFKVKGILKGLKIISRIFAVKEHEMEIGYPTDVKHVAHIGWDTAAGNASPSWMNDLNDIMASSELLSLDNFAASTGTPWVPQDFDGQPRGTQQSSGAVPENSGRQGSDTCPDVPRTPRKTTRRKPKDGLPMAPSRLSSSTEVVASPRSSSAAAGVPVAANGTR